MYVFAGYCTGSPYPIHGFVNLPLGYLTSFLYMILPGVPWWPVLELLAVSASIWIVFVSFLETGHALQISPLFVLALNVVLYATTFVYALARLSFTLTACLLGAAGVVRLLSADSANPLERRNMRGAYVSSLALMALCFLFRNSTGYSLVCFWAAAIVYHALNFACIQDRPERRRAFSRLAGYALSGAILFLSLILLNGWAYQKLNPPEYAAFEDARGRYLDFPHVTYDGDPAFFASIGWDQETYALVGQLCYLDEHVTAETLDAVASYSTGGSRSLLARLGDALGYGELFFRGNGAAEYMLVLPVVLVLWTFVWFLGGKKRWPEALVVAGVALGSFALCFYLCIKQRLIVRSFQVIAVPASLACAPLALRVRAANDARPKRVIGKVLRGGLIVLTLLALSWSWRRPGCGSERTIRASRLRTCASWNNTPWSTKTTCTSMRRGI
jgi:hypothetical protein